MFNLKKTVSSIADVGKNLFKKEDIKQNDIGSIIDLCDDLISNKGAAFGIALARDITDSYESLSLENKLSFLKKINEKFKPNHAKLNEAINAYKILQNDENCTFLLGIFSACYLNNNRCKCNCWTY